MKLMQNTLLVVLIGIVSFLYWKSKALWPQIVNEKPRGAKIAISAPLLAPHLSVIRKPTATAAHVSFNSAKEKLSENISSRWESLVRGYFNDELWSQALDNTDALQRTPKIEPLFRQGRCFVANGNIGNPAPISFYLSFSGPSPFYLPNESKEPKYPKDLVITIYVDKKIVAETTLSQSRSERGTGKEFLIFDLTRSIFQNKVSFLALEVPSSNLSGSTMLIAPPKSEKWIPTSTSAWVRQPSLNDILRQNAPYDACAL